MSNKIKFFLSGIALFVAGVVPVLMGLAHGPACLALGAVSGVGFNIAFVAATSRG